MPDTKINIMIVDDQRTTRMLVRSSLHGLGYDNVTECSDGEEALRVLSERPAQLIISDLNMPKLDGIGLLKAVRGNAELKSIPFIMLTGRGDGALIKDAIQSGVNGYLVKPFNLGALKQKLATALGAAA